jgi:hypothetical protein
LNDERLVRVLTRAGFRGSALKTAFGIAKRESGGRNDAFNPDTSTGDQSYGLFQINMLGNLGPARRKQFGLARNEDLFDPVRNAKAAFRMSSGGRDFGAWGIGPNAYRSGAGYETIAAHVSAFPGVGTLRPSHARATVEAKGEAKAPGFKLPDWSVDSVLGGGGLDDDLSISDGPDLHDLKLSAPPVFKHPEVRARAYGGTTQQAGPTKLAPTPKVNTALEIAKKQLGKPYVWGASSPGVGFDCSGLIEYAFEQAGIPTPGRLTTYTMRNVGRKVPSLTAAQPGDWLITNGGKHVVMYMGNGQVIAAPRTGEVVQYQPVSRFVGQIVDIRRFP